MLSCVTLLLLSPVETETSPRGLLEAALDLAHGVRVWIMRRPGSAMEPLLGGEECADVVVCL